MARSSDCFRIGKWSAFQSMPIFRWVERPARQRVRPWTISVLILSNGRIPMIRSVRIHEFGGADVLKIEDAAVREPGPGQVRLRIHAVGLNRTEVTLRSGRSPVKPSLPCSVGFEAAGVIEALGPDVSGFVVPRN